MQKTVEKAFPLVHVLKTFSPSLNPNSEVKINQVIISPNLLRTLQPHKLNILTLAPSQVNV